MDPIMAALARRLGIMPHSPPPQYPAMSYSQTIDPSLSPRAARLPLLPQPRKTGIAGTPM